MAVSDPRLLWWVDRSAGLVSLTLLTVVLALGVASVGRPFRVSPLRAGVQAVHRQLSLAAVLLLVLHIGTAVADGFVALDLRDVVVPFTAEWKPLWVGLGALTVDLLVVLVVTSLLRARLPRRLWHGLHVLAYALWPLAVAHALALGSDTAAASARWLGVACVAVVAGSLVRRVHVAVTR